MNLLSDRETTHESYIDSKTVNKIILKIVKRIWLAGKV